MRMARMSAFEMLRRSIRAVREGRLRAVNDARLGGQNTQWCTALVVGFEPKLPDAARHSNGSNLRKTGHSADARYAYS